MRSLRNVNRDSKMTAILRPNQIKFHQQFLFVSHQLLYSCIRSLKCSVVFSVGVFASGQSVFER